MAKLKQISRMPIHKNTKCLDSRFCLPHEDDCDYIAYDIPKMLDYIKMLEINERILINKYYDTQKYWELKMEGKTKGKKIN